MGCQWAARRRRAGLAGYSRMGIRTRCFAVKVRGSTARTKASIDTNLCPGRARIAAVTASSTQLQHLHELGHRLRSRLARGCSSTADGIGECRLLTVFCGPFLRSLAYRRQKACSANGH